MATLEGVLGELRAFAAERDWEQFHDPKNLAMAIASEAGELLAEYRWLTGSAADSWSHEDGNRGRVAAEAADIGIALLLFSDRVGFDLLAAISEKIEVNRKNYPVESSRGRSERPST